MKVVPVKCQTHPLYKAIRAPRSFCEPCWRIWIDKKDSQPERTRQTRLSAAGDRRDWDECDRIEAEPRSYQDCQENSRYHDTPRKRLSRRLN